MQILQGINLNLLFSAISNQQSSSIRDKVDSLSDTLLKDAAASNHAPGANRYTRQHGYISTKNWAQSNLDITKVPLTARNF